VYGEGNIGAIGRDSKINPISDYAKSKLCAEEFVSNKKNIKSTVLRLPLVYGDKVKGNLASLGRLASISPLFLNINNARSILLIVDLLNLISKIITDGITGFIHPHSNVISTSGLYKLLRGKRFTFFITIPSSIRNFFIHHDSMIAKIFGDAYYLDEISFVNLGQSISLSNNNIESTKTK
jgi:nucleoside-diphosphate-sugar epimerase